MSDQLNIAELPELPQAAFQHGRIGTEYTKYYTGAQMRSYALAAQAPLVERITSLVNDALIANARADQAEGRVIELERQNAAISDKAFFQGVIAALGALAPHSTHGCTAHDEIVRSVGKEQLYAIAEPEDVEFAGLDPAFYAALASSQGEQNGGA